MILHDNNILSTFAKIDRLDLLFNIFHSTTLHLSGNVETELQAGVSSGVAELQRILDLVVHPQPDMAFQVVRAGPSEQVLYSHIPFYPQNPQRHLKGEVDSVALAWTNGATIVCNERKVYRFCRGNNYRFIPCLNLEDLLRSLWTTNLMSQSGVSGLITQIETHDRVRVSHSEVF